MGGLILVSDVHLELIKFRVAVRGVLRDYSTQSRNEFIESGFKFSL